MNKNIKKNVFKYDKTHKKNHNILFKNFRVGMKMMKIVYTNNT